MRFSFLLLLSLAFSTLTYAQSDSTQLHSNGNFAGADDNQYAYNAIFQLDTNDPKTIQKTFRNIANALKDPRIKDKLKIELVMFSGGTEVNLKDGKYEADLKDLIAKGVTIGQCNNSLVERKLTRDDIYNFIGVVPSGTGEIIMREAQGWGVVKP